MNVMPQLRAEVSAAALFGLAGLRPVAVSRDIRRTIVDVEYFSCAIAQQQGFPCQDCREHDRRPGRRLVPDVPHRGPVALRKVPVRLRRGDCSGVPATPVAFSARLRMTASAAEWALLASMSAPLAEVARAIGCGVDKVSQVFAAIRPQVEAWRPAALPARLGLDGVHTHDGTYTVVADLTVTDDRKGRVLDLLPTHQPDTVRPMLEAWPDRDRVRVVALDPSSSLRALVRELFPNAQIVVDKRHVQHRALECAHEVRKRHAGAVDKTRSRKKEGAPAKKTLARAIDKREAKLTSEDRGLLKAAGPLVAAAYRAKEGFYAIYDTCNSPSEAAAAVVAWWQGLEIGLIDYFAPVHTMVTDTWGDEYRAYYRVSPRITTGFVEAANRTLRGFEADARGNAGHPRLRAQMLYRFRGLSAAQLKSWLAAAL